MTIPREWDHASATAEFYQNIDTRFLRVLVWPDGCEAVHRDGRGCAHVCDRPHGHTGRHLALDFFRRWPIAVWTDVNKAVNPPTEETT